MRLFFPARPDLTAPRPRRTRTIIFSGFHFPLYVFAQFLCRF
jgi:hypothetical protein